MNKIIIHIKAKDRVGIISDISKNINDLKGNIETSKMIKLGKEFNILMLVTIDPNNVSVLKNQFSNYDNLTANIKSTTDSRDKNNLYLFILKGADTEGIVYTFTRFFSSSNINILDLETKTTNAPITGHPLFYIKAKLEVPSSINIESLHKELTTLSDKTNVAIKLKEFDEDFNH